MTANHKPSALIFADLLLAPSMTFVRAQAEALREFVPHYVGSRAVQSGGLALPPDRTLIINRDGSKLGKLKEVPFKVFGYDPWFFRAAQKLQPKFVHAHFGPCAAVALPLVSNLKVPLIVTFHGYDVTVRKECANDFHYTFRLYWRKKASIQKTASLFIAVSEFVKDKLIEQGYPEDKILVHYIGVDTSFFRPNPSVAREPIVLFTARLTEKKGCEYLIRAMERIQAVSPEWKLVVIGDGPLRHSLEQLAKEKLKSYEFHGVQNQQTVREWMNKASVFCVPSLVAANGDAEGFGLVFAEAQAMGLPVVSFRSGGVPEAISHGETGFLADEKNWNDLGDFLSMLIVDPVLRRRMSAAGLRRIRNHFDLTKQTKVLESIYQGVVTRHSESPTLAI